MRGSRLNWRASICEPKLMCDRGLFVTNRDWGRQWRAHGLTLTTTCTLKPRCRARRFGRYCKRMRSGSKRWLCLQRIDDLFGGRFAAADAVGNPGAAIGVAGEGEIR